MVLARPCVLQVVRRLHLLRLTSFDYWLGSHGAFPTWPLPVSLVASYNTFLLLSPYGELIDLPSLQDVRKGCASVTCSDSHGSTADWVSTPHLQYCISGHSISIPQHRLRASVEDNKVRGTHLFLGPSLLLRAFFVIEEWFVLGTLLDELILDPSGLGSPGDGDVWIF